MLPPRIYDAVINDCCGMMASIRKTTVFCITFLALYILTDVKAFSECYSQKDCGYGQYCCERRYPESNVCRSDCIGESCILNSDCAPGESCCDGTDKCAISCVGESCTYNGDCATGECCDSDGKCDSECSLAGWIVAVIVISIIVVVVIPIGVVVFCCCCAAGAAASARRPAHGGVVVTQPTTTGTTVLATQQQQHQYAPAQQGQPMYFQNSQPYPNQPPPYQPLYHQQGTVYPPQASGPPVGTIPPQNDVKQ